MWRKFALCVCLAASGCGTYEPVDSAGKRHRPWNADPYAEATCCDQATLGHWIWHAMSPLPGENEDDRQREWCHQNPSDGETDWWARWHQDLPR